MPPTHAAMPQTHAAMPPSIVATMPPSYMLRCFHHAYIIYKKAPLHPQVNASEVDATKTTTQNVGMFG
jgi:hypothetical protein